VSRPSKRGSPARRRLPPLNAVRAFEAAARHVNFALAADELAVTPGAVSRHVKALEAQIGRKLFDRYPQSLELTEFGRTWLPVVSEAFDTLESGTARLLSERPRATFALNVPTAFATGWLLPRFARFHLEQPELTIRLLTHTDLPDLLREGAPDAAIVHGRGEWPRLNAHFLFADRLIPMCSPAYLAAQRRLVEPAHLLTEALISTDDTAEDWAAWFAMVGLHGEQPQRMMHFANSVLPAHAAMNGLGFALIDPSLVTSELDLGRLIAPLSFPPLMRGTGWYLLHSRVRRKDPVMIAVRNWLQREAGSSVRHMFPKPGGAAYR
jgi:LysR family glycine cleavage system transcriptional activator